MIKAGGGWFAGCSVLVTGGGSGIGAATAVAFATEGADVVVAGRRDDALRTTVESIELAGGKAYAVTADVTDEAAVQSLVDTVTERNGALHVAVNAAGLASWGLTADLPAAEWNAVVAVGLTGVWHCMRSEINQMRRQGGGSIVNISSRIGPHMRVTHQSAYAAAKAGVSALTRSAAREYIRDGIRINAVSPGPTRTAMALWDGETSGDRDRRIARDVPIGRLAEPAEIAAAVLWLAAAESSFVVGHDLVVDGGVSS